MRLIPKLKKEMDSEIKERNGKIREALTVLASIAFLSGTRDLDEKEKGDWEEKLKEVTLLLPKQTV